MRINNLRVPHTRLKVMPSTYRSITAGRSWDSFWGIINDREVLFHYEAIRGSYMYFLYNGAYYKIPMIVGRSYMMPEFIDAYEELRNRNANAVFEPKVTTQQLSAKSSSTRYEAIIHEDTLEIVYSINNIAVTLEKFRRGILSDDIISLRTYNSSGQSIRVSFDEYDAREARSIVNSCF